MTFTDILHLALRNLRQAKLRATLTTMGVIVGVSVIVTMVSFGLGLQRNMLARFKALDLFNEIRVFGRGLNQLALSGFDRGSARGGDDPSERREGRLRPDKSPTRILDDAAVADIAKIDGVAYVEPNISFMVYVRSNGRVLTQFTSGTTVPNASSLFQEFVAGKMISGAGTEEAVVSERFARDFGYEKPADAVGKTLEFLAPPDEERKDEKADQKELENAEENGPANFFGIPLDEEESNNVKAPSLVAHTFRIAGVLNTEVKEGPGQGGLRGLMPSAGIYIPLQTARQWSLEHRGPMSQVALALARGSGALRESEAEGYDSAVVRVTNTIVLTQVRKRLTELGFGSFSIVDQLEQFRTVFLIIDSVLGLLGGISLLVASFSSARVRSEL